MGKYCAKVVFVLFDVLWVFFEFVSKVVEERGFESAEAVIVSGYMGLIQYECFGISFF